MLVLYLTIVMLVQRSFCSAPPVQLFQQPNQVVIDNGILKLTISNPGGLIREIGYNGIDNILATSANSGYWDFDWESDTGAQVLDRLLGAQLKVISHMSDQVEISFVTVWRKGLPFPMNVERRFVVLRGTSGFYTYAIFKRNMGWPRVSMNNLRIVFKLKENQFKYMAISDKRQKVMPTGAERANGTQLDYKEAVLLKNGQVDDKYQYSADNKDSHLHGWIADNPATGFWLITPSDEFRIGGPFRQDLTSHTAATTLSIFASSHYAYKGPGITFKEGERWTKVFGPVFIYLNSGVNKEHRQELWQNAKAQMSNEMTDWPYKFPLSEDFLKGNQRGLLVGQLQVLDRYVNKDPKPASFVHVGLALPGEVGSWETENKGYQFWTEADKKGYFVIKDIIPGIYDLYAWGPGYIGDYKYSYPVKITSGGVVKLMRLLFEPPRNGPTIWEIGKPDRTAAEFFIPNVNPQYANDLYSIDDKFRQYGLWQRYTDLYPEDDLTFRVGLSNYENDWFFAHVQRMNKGGNFTSTTWKINFKLNSVAKNQTYTLRLAFASATYAKLRIAINEGPPIKTVGPLGSDNAIARHGIHGLYKLAEVGIPSGNFFRGENNIYLTLVQIDYAFSGVMYDYIRLEGPAK